MAKKFNFTSADKNNISDYIISQQRTRNSNRSHFNKEIVEIDRQLRMEPDISVKKDSNGNIDQSKAWMPEAELPLQSQTLEIHQADVMRMVLPRTGSWFEAHSMLSDSFLESANLESIIAGDENDIPTQMNQITIDQLVAGTLNHWHRQYDFRGHLSMILGESIKYSMGIGRALVANRRVFLHSSKGVVKKEMRIPILTPRSIKNTWLDDKTVDMMNEGYIVSPGTIFKKHIQIKDVQMAAAKGNSDTNDIISGGWVKNALNGIDGDKDGIVELIEWEGDMVTPRRTTDPLYLPNAIITIIIGQKGKQAESRIVRIRKNVGSFSSVIEFPYQREHIDSPYGSSPCIKGRPVQGSSVFALNRVMESAAYDAQPAITYGDGDVKPQIYPGAKVCTDSDINVLKIGNTGALFGVYQGFLSQFADVTGVNAPRLGAQTVSHTTAFAKDAELQRGQARTVDFVDDTLSGPLERFLDIEYELTKLSISGKVNLLLPEMNGYITISKKLLPEEVSFSVHGANGPAEDAQKVQNRLQSLNQAVQMDTLLMQQQIQLGQQPKPVVNLEEAIKQTLRDGGWIDTDAITSSEEPVEAPQGQAGVAGNPEGNPGNTSTALQALAFGQQ